MLVRCTRGSGFPLVSGTAVSVDIKDDMSDILDPRYYALDACSVL